MKRKLLIALGILVALVAILGIAQVVVAGYLFDKNIDKVIARLQRQVPALSLSYTPGNGSLTTRSGRLDWQLKLPPNNSLGLPYISGSTLTQVEFGLLKVNAGFNKVNGSGNLDELLAKLNLEPIGYRAALEGKLLPPRVHGAIKTTPFTLPLTHGSCVIGENSLYASGSGPDNLHAELNLSGFKCQGSELYAGKESYMLNLKALQLSVDPRLELASKRVYVDSLQVSIDEFMADLSTLFMLGFNPDEEVKDPTLRDNIVLTNFKSTLAFSDIDASGSGYLNFDTTGNYAWGFPAVKHGTAQDLYRLDNLHVSGKTGRLAVKDLFKALSKMNESDGFDHVLACFSPRQEFTLDDFSFDHQGQQVKVQGHSVAELDFAALKIKSMQADFNLAGGNAFVEGVAGEKYAPALALMVHEGYVTYADKQYRTHLTINNQEISLNERPLNLRSSEDEDY